MLCVILLLKLMEPEIHKILLTLLLLKKTAIDTYKNPYQMERTVSRLISFGINNESDET